MVLPVAHPAASETVQQQVILHGISWGTYQRLLAEHQESSGTRFTYDRGDLEIMVLSAEHENYKDVIVLLLNILAEEMGIDVSSFGSTTFRREDLARGFEPDGCFYIQNEERIRGKKQIDLTVDPPPDLVIEVDITSLSLDKFPIFAASGVGEVWRYDETRVAIFKLEGGHYVEQAESAALPIVTGAALTDFVEASQQMKRTVWLRRVREWVRARRAESNA
jgi:Uma2 family endonuclease